MKESWPQPHSWSRPSPRHYCLHLVLVRVYPFSPLSTHPLTVLGPQLKNNGLETFLRFRKKSPETVPIMIPLRSLWKQHPCFTLAHGFWVISSFYYKITSIFFSFTFFFSIIYFVILKFISVLREDMNALRRSELGLGVRPERNLGSLRRGVSGFEHKLVVNT